MLRFVENEVRAVAAECADRDLVEGNLLLHVRFYERSGTKRSPASKTSTHRDDKVVIAEAVIVTVDVTDTL